MQIPVALRAFHWQPVRSTKKIASIAARSGTRGLWQPSGWRGRGGNSGSIRIQRSSGMRQPSSATAGRQPARLLSVDIPDRWVADGPAPPHRHPTEIAFYSEESIKVIDPRGSFVQNEPSIFSDVRSDLAKLYHSLEGYDFIPV